MSSRMPDPTIALNHVDVEIETSEGTMATHVVHPSSGGPFPTVLFFMDAPGKRPLLHRMAAVIASHGYFVMLPNLYYRQTPAFELDFASKDSMQQMSTLMRGVGNRMVARDTEALLEFAASHGQADASAVGTVGYCMSGPFALFVAADQPQRVRCAASFYGVRLATDSEDSPHARLDDIAGEIYVGAAEFDDYVPLDMIERFEAARQAADVPGAVEVYWGCHHGFAFDDRPAYDSEADDRHWTALLGLFERNLSPHRRREDAMTLEAGVQKESWLEISGPGEDFVATVELARGPNNFFSFGMIDQLATTLEMLDRDDQCRAIVLCAQGKHFCAGADFASPDRSTTTDQLYGAAVRLFRTSKPVVAAIQGAAIGGGLGLALAADFRLASPSARFSANFARLGFHHGFGLSVTLPRLVGPQQAARMLFTGERINGVDAVGAGLADRLVADDDLRASTHALAADIASSAPLAVESIRATLRGGLADEIERATRHEATEQARLQATADFAEGIRSVAERRPADFRRA